MKTKVISCLGIILCFAVAGAAKPTPTPADKATQVLSKVLPSNFTAKDKAFMMSAAKGGQMEVEWGKLAAQKGQSADVRNFGNRMVADHTKANTELMGLAMQEGLKLPASKATGKWKSDKDYVNMMVKDHQKDLAEFQNEAQNGVDPDMKKFADKYAQVVKAHLDTVKEMQRRMK
jgi:putative membrane protein